MAVAIFKNTNLKSLMANLKLELRLDRTTAEDIFLKRYTLLCAKALNTALQFEEKTLTLPIVNFIAQLPCEFYKFDRPNPIVFTTNGQVTNSGYFNYFSVTYMGSAFFVCSPFNPNNCGWGIPTVQVQNGYLYFSNNIGASECTISCLCVRVDEDGMPVIPLICERVIVAGAAYMYKRSVGQQYQDLQREWSNGKRDVTGELNLPDDLQQAAASRIWNSILLPYPNI